MFFTSGQVVHTTNWELILFSHEVVCWRDWRKKDNSRNKSSLVRQTWSYDLTERRAKHSLQDQNFRALHSWGDNWPRSQCRPSDDDSKLINFAESRINILCFGLHISTFFQANAVKTEFVLHLIADRETAGLTLWVQCKILWVNAIFVCKFDSFPVSVLSSNWLKFPTLSIIYNTVGAKKKIKIRSNLV